MIVFLFLRLYVCVSLFLLTSSLVSQQDNGHQLQWASTVRYGQALFVTPTVEPSRNGDRTILNQRLVVELEARKNKHWSYLAAITIDWLRTFQEEQLLNTPADLSDPFALLHPYTSRLGVLSFQLGTQYNHRLTENGDLSLSLQAGVGLRSYSRAYDLIRGRGTNLIFDGIAVDVARNIHEWQATCRLQYTHWFDHDFAVQAGLYYTLAGYLGGGIDTSSGTRYAHRTQESTAMTNFYRRNYDRSTLFPDPTISLQRLGVSLGVTQRL